MLKKLIFHLKKKNIIEGRNDSFIFQFTNFIYENFLYNINKIYIELSRF